MADIPYLTKTTAIKEFLEKIQETGVPAKIDREYLPSIGFTSSSDRPLITLFKFLGFLDKSGAPTDLYHKYREKQQARKVLGKALMTAYSGLFATYPNAHKRDNDALADYFRTKTGLGGRAVSALVNTFKALAENAEFEGVDEIALDLEEEAKIDVAKTTKRRVDASLMSGGPSIAINIQLQLPVTENETVYDKLFISLRKNLLTPAEKEEK